MLYTYVEHEKKHIFCFCSFYYLSDSLFIIKTKIFNNLFNPEFRMMQFSLLKSAFIVYILIENRILNFVSVSFYEGF